MGNLKNALLWSVLVAVTSCKTPGTESELRAGKAVSWLEGKMARVGCDISGLGVKEKDVFACAEKMQSITPEEFKALKGDGSKESALMNHINEAIVNVSIVAQDPKIINKATKINQMFEIYREGGINAKGERVEPIGKVITDIAKESNRYKLTIYIVALMEGGYKAQLMDWENKGGAPETKPAKMELKDEIAKATDLVDIIAMESCSRGFALPLINLATGNMKKNLPEWLLKRLRVYGSVCDKNKYIEWSQISQDLKKYGLKDLKFIDGQKVVLLKNSPAGFNVREALFKDDKSLLPPSMDWLKTSLGNDSLRSGMPFVWTWMWGFYDDAVGFKYANLFMNPPRVNNWPQDTRVFMDMNLLGSAHHTETASILVESEGLNTYTRSFKFSSKNNVVLGKMYPDSHIGHGMHKKGMIFDKRYFIMGGRNFGIDYTKYWRDTDVLISGSFVRDVAVSFYKKALKEGSEKVSTEMEENSPKTIFRTDKKFYKKIQSSGGLDSVALVLNDPAINQRERLFQTKDSNVDKILSVYIDMIAKAKWGSTIYIENAYLILTPPLKKAIADAIKRDIIFEIYTNSPNAADEAIVAMPIMLSVRELLELNPTSKRVKNPIRFHLRRARYIPEANDHSSNATVGLGPNNIRNVMPTMEALKAGKTLPSTLHSKYMLVETKKSPTDKNSDYMVIVGSYNLHPRGLRYEEEMAVVIKNSSPTKGVYNSFLKWFKHDDLLSNAPGTILSDITLVNADDIPVLLPVDWRDPRSGAKGGNPIDGKFALINGGVAAAMTVGFEQL